MEIEDKPPQKKPGGVSFLLVLIGLFLLICATELLISHKSGALGWGLFIIGLGLIFSGVFWATGRI